MATSAGYGRLPFQEQIEFFRRKLNLPTTSWADIYGAEHDRAFVVAGANRDALVADFRRAVERAINDGGTLEDFRRDFDTIVARHGWDYNGSRNWRSKVIYDTNLRNARAAGRYQRLQAAKTRRPFWRWNHSDAVEHPRPLHLAWDGMVLHADDPWWQEHFPPCGWGCQCYVTAHNERELRAMGKTGPDPAPRTKYVTHVVGKNSVLGPRTVRVPEGVDPGFEYTPGRSFLESATPRERSEPLSPGGESGEGTPNRPAEEPLPPPRRVRADRVLPAGQSPATSVVQFLEQMGGSMAQPAIARDAIGERLVIGARQFRSGDSWGTFATSSGRYVLLLADTIRDPDEIWARIEWIPSIGAAAVRRRYLSRYVLPGETQPLAVVFEVGTDGWAGYVSAQESAAATEAWRVGVKLYGRDDQE
ncbi:PBECR2 nuclease fold domain-containing protein [Achromobacter insolitus]|uniref:PBECR2 nuclease fold domain-containing protein n=1 Tax=Achromobacter insolitus TaxID=217204 RepID=UPI001EEEB322|nr:PBECR2 nuclease fold domain-containing protein [Achromobacter insolitus]